MRKEPLEFDNLEGTLVTLTKSVSEEWWRQEPDNSGMGEMGVEKGEFVSAEDLQGYGDTVLLCVLKGDLSMLIGEKGEVGLEESQGR